VRDPRERLRDILEAIHRIERHAARGRQAFETDELLQSWFVRNLQVIGAAVRALPEDFRNRAPEIPWSKIIGMRHILVHGYFEIDTQVVWEAVERDLHPLKESIARLLRQLPE
jgi:uncharacterized protein with HEPN domain